MNSDWDDCRNEESKSWWDISKVGWHELVRDDRPIEVQYEDVDIEYKDEARRQLSEELGFEPDLRVSSVAELYHRDSLKRYYSGELSEENLNIHRITRACIIRNRILKEIPEQAHLAAQYTKEFPL